jgi:drug/metabolite transporter (DMT)-like permease
MNSAVPSNRTELRRAVAALVFITMLWGVSFPLVKMNNLLMRDNQRLALGSMYEKAAPFDLDLSAAALTMTMRFGLSFAVLMLFFPRHFGRLTVRQWLMGGAAGFVFAVGLLLQIFALNEIPASRSGFLTSLSVVFTPLMLIAVTRRRPPLHVILAVAVALFGVAILTETVRFDADSVLRLSDDFRETIGVGDVLTILAAAVFAVEIIMIDTFSRRMPPGLLTPGMFAATVWTGAAVFGIHQATWAHAPSAASWARLFTTPAFPLLSIAICLICTLVPFHYMNKYQAKVTPTQAALIYTLEPVFTIAWAMFLPDMLSPLLGLTYASEALNWALIGGGGLVIAANVLGFWPTPD